MPLNIDWSRCDPAATADENAKLVTKACGFATMSTGINPITEKNFGEFARRVAEVERVSGAYITSWDGEKLVERPITTEDVKLRIGLRTNASPLTKTAFNANIKRADKRANL